MSDWTSHPPTNPTNPFHIRPSTHASICLRSKELVLEVLPYLCLGAEFLLVGSSAYVTGLRKKVCVVYYKMYEYVRYYSKMYKKRHPPPIHASSWCKHPHTPPPTYPIPPPMC